MTGTSRHKDINIKHLNKMRLAYFPQLLSQRVVYHAMSYSQQMVGSISHILLIISAASAPKVLVVSPMTGSKKTVHM
jgi:hypothetical protein